jgi:hypothetical protein
VRRAGIRPGVRLHSAKNRGVRRAAVTKLRVVIGHYVFSLYRFVLQRAPIEAKEMVPIDEEDREAIRIILAHLDV